jgi:uncharacterized protein YcbK (DUF882 family)
MPQLTAHFHTREFMCHDGTAVPKFAHDDLLDLCTRYLEPLRARFGPVTIVSGYRHRAYNRSIGGAPESFHIYLPDRRGAAADIKCSRGQPSSWHSALAAMGPGGLGRYPAHVHVDNRAGRARW